MATPREELNETLHQLNAHVRGVAAERAVEQADTMEEAAGLLGVDRKTLYRWRTEAPEVADLGFGSDLDVDGLLDL